MAKKVAKKAPTSAAKTSTARTKGGGAVRLPAKKTGDNAQPGNASSGDDQQGGPSRGAESELSRLERERDDLRSRGVEQPHPQAAPRIAATSTQAPPLNRAHQTRQVDDLDLGSDTIPVRATQLGVYDDVRRREGDTFVLKPKRGFRHVPVLDKDDNPVLDRNDNVVMSRKPKEVVISAEEQFSEEWMERLDGDDVEEHITTSPEALKRENLRLLAEKAAGGKQGKRGTGDQDVI